MSNFRASILIGGDAKEGQKALQDTAKTAKSTAKAVDDVGKASKNTATETKGLGGASITASGQVQALSAAEIRATSNAQGLAAANRMAAGSMGNLAAQGNDVVVMTAAMQNPMMLALQQGTQITQVMGHMGAAGAFQALKGAVLQMISPVSLLTIGLLAGGVALVQWGIRAAGADEKTRTFEETLDDLGTATDNYREAADLTTASVEELEDKFGSASGSIRATLRLLEGIAASEAQRAIDDISTSLADLMSNAGDGDKRGGVADFFDVNIGLAFTQTQREARAEARQLTAEFVAQQTVLKNSEGDLNAQIGAMQSMVAVAGQLADASGDRSADEDALLKKLGDALLAMQEQRGAVVDAAQAGKSAYDQYYASRIASEDQLASMRARELSEQAAIYGAYAQTRTLSNQAVTESQDLLATMIAQNNLQIAINQHGADSVQVTQLRAAAERDAFEELLASMQVSEELKDQLRGAHIIAQDLSATNVGAGIDAAVGSAQALSDELGISLSIAARINNMSAASRAGVSGPDGAIASLQNEGRLGGGPLQDVVSRVNVGPRFNRQPRVSGGAGRRSGGAGGAGGGQSDAAREAQRERDSVEDLIQSLEDELAIMREIDPVQKEMLRQRDALTGATAAERDQVQSMIQARIDETAALDLQTQQWDAAKGAASGFFDDLRNKSVTFEQSLQNIVDRLQDMVYQAVLFGEGPLASMFGSAGSGGLIGTGLGALFPSLAPAAAIPAHKDGGLIYGPGDGRSDDVLMYGSSGEFMMNARATGKHRGLLEFLNGGGSLPGFAAGGAIGGGSSGGGFGAPTFNVAIDNRGSTPVQGDIKQENDGAGGRRFKLILADQVGNALTLPGGGARKAMGNTFGLKQKGSLR